MSKSALGHFRRKLSELSESGNLRTLPPDLAPELIDFTSNDYLGFAADKTLRERFFSLHDAASLPLSSSASRLLAGAQKEYASLENAIVEAYRSHIPGYGADALLFNSGYHANSGIIPALADRGDLILADRLVHASIIDGIRLSGARHVRFPHNDFKTLRTLVERNRSGSGRILIIVESVYSMDGDTSPLGELAEIKRAWPEILLYVDEAHAVGVRGPAGLGEAVARGVAQDFDIIAGTFGKALASAGAFALLRPPLKEYLVNKARPLIFSTALSPMSTVWTEFVWRHSLGSDTARSALKVRAEKLASLIPGGEPSHIRPLVTGDPIKAVALSRFLKEGGFNVLPIRTPTVPLGTERLRFSLSASLPEEALRCLGKRLEEFKRSYEE